MKYLMVVFLMVGSMFGQQGAFEQEPNLKETLDWMQTSLKADRRFSFVQENAPGARNTDVENSELVPDGCQMTINTQSSGTVYSPSPRKVESAHFMTDSYQFNLRDLDPNAIKVNPQSMFAFLS